MALNKPFGSDIRALRSQRYCWVVTGQSPLSPKRFPGAEKFPKSTVWELGYMTRPGHQCLSFATGVGIIGYTYRHHGTLSNTELKMIEFGKGKEEKKKE